MVETAVRGGETFRGRLPQPRTVWQTYRDIAVLAFPVPPAERERWEDAAPTAHCDAADFQGAKILDGNLETAVQLPRPAAQGATKLTITFGRPFVARTVELAMNTGRSAERLEVLAGNATNALRRVAEVQVPSQLHSTMPHAVVVSPFTARVVQLRFLTPLGERIPRTIHLAEVRLSGGRRIEQWAQKAAFVRGARLRPP